MKALRKYKKPFCIFAQIFTAIVLLAVVFRALSIARNEGSDGIKIDSSNLGRYLWLELKSLFHFSRY